MAFNAPFSRLVRPAFGPGLAVSAGITEYYQKILATQAESLIGLWRLNETSGTQATDYSGNSNHGQYLNSPSLANTPGPDGNNVPLFDGSNQSVSLIQPGSEFNPALDGDEGTLLCWVKIYDLATWEDGTNDMLVTYGYNASNYLEVKKDAGPNYGIAWRRVASGSTESNNYTTIRSLLWMMVSMTWSDSGDLMKYYYYDSDKGFLDRGSDAGLASWGGVDARQSYLGAFQNGASTFKGWIGPCALWKTPLSAAELEYLSDVTV